MFDLARCDVICRRIATAAAAVYNALVQTGVWVAVDTYHLSSQLYYCSELPIPSPQTQTVSPKLSSRSEFSESCFYSLFFEMSCAFLVQSDNKTQEPHNYRPLACFAKYSFKLLTYRRRDAGSTNLPLRLASLCIDRSRCHSVLGSLIEHDY